MTRRDIECERLRRRLEMWSPRGDWSVTWTGTMYRAANSEATPHLEPQPDAASAIEAWGGALAQRLGLALAGIFLTALAASAARGEIWRAATLPTSPRILVVHGADLWRGNPQDLRRLPTARLGGVELAYYPDGAAPGTQQPEPNFAVRRVLQFIAPDSIEPGDGPLVVTSCDGRRFEGVGRIHGRPALSDAAAAGTVLTISRPIEVTEDWNARGLRVRPGEGYAGRWLIRLRRGVVRDLEVDVPDRVVRGDPQWGVYIDQDGDAPVGLERVRVRQGVAGGAAVYVQRCYDAVFHRVDASGDYCLDAAPNARHGRNVWHECTGSPRTIGGPPSGQMGRALLGEQNIAYGCAWVGLDRGPVSQSAGPPQRRTLVYRCRQERTGTAVGGSEGILWEGPQGSRVAASIEGRRVRVVDPPAGAVDDRVGLGVWHLPSQRVARIEARAEEVADGRPVLVLDVDRDLPPGAADVVVGNGPVECTIANCAAYSGCRWVYLFCRTSDVAILGGDVRGVHDAVTYLTMDRAAPPSIAFAWRLQFERVRVAPDVVRPVVESRGYDPARTIDENLPWYREAK